MSSYDPFDQPLTIYDSLADRPDLFIPAAELENRLRAGLAGLSLKYPLRTRSKVLKAKVCEVLGYPVPKSFTKTQPRFPGQNLDTYVQKSDNLQIWNEEIDPARRYAIIRVDEDDMVTNVRVVTGEELALLDTTGTLTQKYQANSREPVTRSTLVVDHDTEQFRLASAASDPVSRPLPIGDVHRRLLALEGIFIADPGLDQERNRGGLVHRLACEALGVPGERDEGQFPDIVSQRVEVKLQTAPTVDLGLVSPDSMSVAPRLPGLRHCDIRYAVVYGESVQGGKVRLNHIVTTTGESFFGFFRRFEGRTVNKKLQIPLPRDFFR